PRLGGVERHAVDRGRTVGEPPLGTAHANALPTEESLLPAGEPVQSVALGHRSGRRLRNLGGDAGALVLGEDVDATLMALLVRPRGGQERVDDGEGLLGGVHAAADADQLCVVVLACELCGLDAPGERAAGAG